MRYSTDYATSDSIRIIKKRVRLHFDFTSFAHGNLSIHCSHHKFFCRHMQNFMIIRNKIQERILSDYVTSFAIPIMMMDRQKKWVKISQNFLKLSGISRHFMTFCCYKLKSNAFEMPSFLDICHSFTNVVDYFT